MKLFEYISSIASSFNKKNLLALLRNAVGKIDSEIIPEVTSFKETLSIDKMQSLTLKTFVKDFTSSQTIKIKNVNDIITAIGKALQHASDLGKLLDNQINVSLRDKIYVEGITYQSATVIKLIDAVDFIGDYTSRLLTYLVNAEVDKVVFDKPEAESISKKEIEYIKYYLPYYVKHIAIFLVPSTEILKNVDEIPEITVMGDEPLPEGITKQDPLQLGFVPILTPLLFTLAANDIDKTKRRLDRTIAERKAIEHRLEAYRQKQQSGVPDARLERIIGNLDNELTILRSDIARDEEKLGVHK